MINSWKFLLRSDLPKNSLQQLNFSVFGLGDSSYEKFNAMAKKLTQRLIDLGANLFHKVGLGDYQHDFNYEGEFDPWLNNLWQSMNKVLVGKFINLGDIPEDKLLPPIYKVEFMDHVAEENYSTLNQLPPPNGAINKQVYLSKVIKNTRITAEDHFQDTRHIVLDNSQQNKYDPGDIVMIQPKNNPKQIQEFIERYGLKPNQLLKIKVDLEQLGQICSTSVIQFPEEGIKVEELFEYWLNLMDPPSRYFVKILSFFVEDKQRAEKLKEFASKTSVITFFFICFQEGKSEYHRYCIRERRTIPEVMLDFLVTDQFPLAYLIQLAGRQRPREFSISSYHQKVPNEIHLTMAVTDYTTKFKRHKRGVCSSWLSEQDAEKTKETVPIWLEKGTMKIPPIKDGKTYPIIMVGPGTGVAAFRSFIQYLAQYPDQEIVLVFGSRSETKDYYYEDEWKQYPNLKLITAFSRFQDDQKVYVQHKIRDESDYLSKLIIEKQAHIYVSGRAKNMPKSVEKAFIEIIQKHYPDLNALEYVMKARKNGQYQQEVW
ncbi:nadph-dependent diflavin oxidoreductase 1 [Stylonychia lemnae]|uniref:Nadph-dependent diflavin oxidoreductase 1 n=1 Tax=Stylonychia lemnae TaxID=5949 RepID=A0A077ZSQ2_STYLE|nr:nadph-dependent diflavin oxidoreductase 1 [Stylonychia lemnae]|eukprot:CDW72589.1 nadph-dependent diflavin oxidoreductase 1 [Stylonychia lemnae]